MRRRVGSLFIICAAIPIAVFASTAWACGALTTSKVDNAAPAPNQVINVTGRNFATNTSTSGGCPCTGVDIRLDSRSGQVLANVPTGGNFTVPVRVPASTQTGWHLLVLTQSTIATGVPKSGTPARATISSPGRPRRGLERSVGSRADWRRTG